MRIDPGILALGTMRMAERNRPLHEWTDFFVAAHRAGVRWIHCSSEYDSYPLLCECLAALKTTNPEVQFRFMVKLADPGFSESTFEKARFLQKISDYCHQLGSGTIGIVQWMWRPQATPDDRRIAKFLEVKESLNAAFAEAISSGCAERILCFPYTVAFAEAALAINGISGLAVYRNPLETEYDHALDACVRCEKSATVIRPFGAGKAFTNNASPHSLVLFAASHSAVTMVVVGVSTISHLHGILADDDH